VINGINGFGQSFVLAAVYYSGTELVAVTAGESKRPLRDVPKVRDILDLGHRTLLTDFIHRRPSNKVSSGLLSSTGVLPSSPVSASALSMRCS